MADYPIRVERFAERFMKKVVGRWEIDDALRRLDKLMQAIHRMEFIQQVLGATHDIHDKVTVLVDGV